MFGLPTELITKGKLITVEIRVLTFRALALHQSELRNCGLFVLV